MLDLYNKLVHISASETLLYCFPRRIIAFASLLDCSWFCSLRALPVLLATFTVSRPSLSKLYSRVNTFRTLFIGHWPKPYFLPVTMSAMADGEAQAAENTPNDDAHAADINDLPPHLLVRSCNSTCKLMPSNLSAPTRAIAVPHCFLQCTAVWMPHAVP